MTTNERLAIAACDPEHQDHVLSTVDGEQVAPEGSLGRVSLSFVDGGSISAPLAEGVRAPEVGDTIRLFGRGFGYPVRGLGLVVHGVLIGLYRYQTADEAKAAHEAWCAQQKQQRNEAWTAQSAAFAEKIKALPDVFRERIEFFMRKADWGPEFGPYEIFACTEAVKIATAFRTEEEVRDFQKKPYEEQRKALPALSEDHSGNTFGTACSLARFYLKEPELVPKMHGAMCPLAGCEDYGCWATTPEAKAEAKAQRGPT